MKHLVFAAVLLASTAAHAGFADDQSDVLTKSLCNNPDWECSTVVGGRLAPPPTPRPTDAEMKAARHLNALRECDKLPTTIGVLLCRADAE
jgi:hypothetical protein